MNVGVHVIVYKKLCMYVCAVLLHYGESTALQNDSYHQLHKMVSSTELYGGFLAPISL